MNASVYRRKSDGRWVGSLNLGQENGKRSRKIVYGASATEVEAKLQEFLKPVQKSSGTVQDYMTSWLQDSVRLRTRINTQVMYRGSLVRYVFPVIGSVSLSDLTSNHIRMVLNQMEDRGHSPRLRQLIRGIMLRALNQAVVEGLIPRNPVLAVVSPKVPRPVMKVWTQDQLRAFLVEAQTERLYPLFLLEAETGLREGELLGLQWSDLDLRNKTLTVTHNLLEVRGRPLTLAEVKTRESNRMLTLSSTVVSALVRWRERLMSEGLAGSSFVFPSRSGTPIWKANLVEVFKRVCVRARVPVIRFHDQRHTNATLLLERKTPVKTVQGRLGHASANVTLNVYAKFTKKADEQAVTVMEEVLYA